MESTDLSRYQSFWKWVWHYIKDLYHWTNNKIREWLTKDNVQTTIVLIIFFMWLLAHFTLIMVMLFGVSCFTTPYEWTITICVTAIISDIVLLYIDYISNKRSFLGRNKKD